MTVSFPSWGASLVNPDGTLKRPFIDLLRALTSASTTTTTQSSGPTAADLLAAMYGTDGVTIIGSIETGVQIQGPGTTPGVLASQIFGS